MVVMKKFFYYSYYRIAQAYRSFNDEDYLDWGYYILFTSFMFLAFSIAIPISYVLDAKLTKTAFVIIALPFLGLYACTFFISEERKTLLYKKLESQYKNDPHKKVKGWLVALYVVGTFVLLNIMCIIFVLK